MTYTTKSSCDIMQRNDLSLIYLRLVSEIAGSSWQIVVQACGWAENGIINTKKLNLFYLLSELLRM